MRQIALARSVVCVLAVLALASTRLEAQTVQISPFGSFEFGGALSSPVFGSVYSIGSSLGYGGTVDIAIARSWRVELLYSRHTTELEASGGPSGPRFDLAMERYMVGIEEEKGEEDGKTKFFGVFLLGATRFNPSLPQYGSDTSFTLGLALGVKLLVSKNVGFRFEGRGYYTPLHTNATLICNGACLFGASGSGLFQGDLSAGLIIAF
jgi:hypothetical protein